MLPLDATEKTVAKDEVLLRRIPNMPHNPQIKYIVYDEAQGTFRPTSVAFDLRPHESYLSVDRLTILLARGKDALFSLNENPAFGLVQLSNNDFTLNNITVTAEPVEGNPAHAKAEGNFSKRVRKALAQCCSWVKQPDNV